MVLLKSFTCITTCVLLLQYCAVQAAPLGGNRPLVKRGRQLHGKFLHITDIHIDPAYREGADPDSLCHRHGKKRSTESGKFGALGTDCDSPVSLVQATFDFLKKEIRDIDFIIYTGDTVRHDRDDDMPITRSDVIDGHKSVMKYFQSAYNFDDTPFLPTIGNNDGFDHNDIGHNDKIFDTLETIWQPLGLNLNQGFSSGGYFVQEVIQGKLSIINLNSMYFFSKNDDVSDCGSSNSPSTTQMKWLETTLKSFAQKKGQHQVYIMGHVPPIDDDGSRLFKSKCYTQYFDLLGQYGNVIAGHFTGHTNNDNLNAVVPSGGKSYKFIAADDNSAKNKQSTLDKTTVGLFNAPSILPKNNPALRVYSYDISGGKYPIGTVRDWDQYYVDLDKANSERTLKFELEYKASKLYGVDHFDGAGVGQAVLNIGKNKSSRDLYKKYAGVST